MASVRRGSRSGTKRRLTRMRRRRSRRRERRAGTWIAWSQPMIRASGFALLVGLAACAPADPSPEDSESGTANDELVGAPPTALLLAQSLDTGGFRQRRCHGAARCGASSLAATGAKLYAMGAVPGPVARVWMDLPRGRLVRAAIPLCRFASRAQHAPARASSSERANAEIRIVGSSSGTTCSSASETLR